PAELPAAQRPRPGDLVTTTITRAAPHYLISDSALAAPLGELSPEQFSVRRTFSEDAWEAGVRGSDGGASSGTGRGGPAAHARGGPGGPGPHPNRARRAPLPDLRRRPGRAPGWAQPRAVLGAPHLLGGRLGGGRSGQRRGRLLWDRWGRPRRPGQPRPALPAGALTVRPVPGGTHAAGPGERSPERWGRVRRRGRRARRRGAPRGCGRRR